MLQLSGPGCSLLPIDLNWCDGWHHGLFPALSVLWSLGLLWQLVTTTIWTCPRMFCLPVKFLGWPGMLWLAINLWFSQLSTNVVETLILNYSISFKTHFCCWGCDLEWLHGAHQQEVLWSQSNSEAASWWAERWGIANFDNKFWEDI